MAIPRGSCICMTVAAALCLLLLVARAPSQLEGQPGKGKFCKTPLVFWDKDKDKCGFRTIDGQVVVPPKFDVVMEETFRDGLVPVAMYRQGQRTEPLDRKELLWGYADVSGKLVIAPRFAEAWHFSEGMGPVQGANELWGFVSRSGHLAIPPKFELVGDFHEGMAQAYRGEKIGFINLKGEWVIEPRFLEADDFSEGLAAVEVDVEIATEKDSQEPSAIRSMWGFIDRSGKFVIGPHFPERPTPFSSGLAGVKSGKQWGFINHQGDFAIAPRFCEITPFSEGVAAVSVAGKLTCEWGFIDKTGREVIAARFQSARPFSRGLASVKVKGQYGLINHAAEFVVPAKYAGAISDRNGYIALHTFLDGKIYMDRQGHMMVREPDDPTMVGNVVRKDDEVGEALPAILKKYGKPTADSTFTWEEGGRGTPLRRHVWHYIPETRHQRVTVRELIYNYPDPVDGGRHVEQRWFWLLEDEKGSWIVITNLFKPKYATF